VLTLATPIIGENLLQTLVGAVDTFMVARLGAAAVAGVGIGFELVFFIISILSAIDIGATVLVSQAIGAGHQERANRLKTEQLARRQARKVSLEEVFSRVQEGEITELNIVLKADVHGSLEAVTEALRRLEREEVKLAFVQRGVGGITENDVMLAATTNATIIGFNVRPDRKSRDLADHEDVEIRTYEVIYKLLEDIEQAMVGMLAPEYEEVVTGEAEVREVFRVPRVGAIAGCQVRSGVITRGSKVRFLRDGVIIWKGEIASLKRFKDDAREVQSGYECGIVLHNFQNITEGDVLEVYETRQVERQLQPS